MVKGFWQPQWAPLVEAFADNFAGAGEQGAGLALHHRGEWAVNIWAGEYSNRAAQLENKPWSESTCVNIFSAGKGLVALCILRLVAQGRLDLERPVADYWPEFAQAGKQQIRVRDVLCHRSGLSAFNQHIGDAAIFNWPQMIQSVAAETPWWQPDTAQGYSPFLFGWLLGELIVRASNSSSFDDYFQREIAAPLAVDCYFGVPDDLLPSIADSAPLKKSLSDLSVDSDIVALGKIMKANPRGVTNRAFCNPISLMTASNSREWRQAQIPAANAHTNAAGLARIYGALAGAGGDLLPASHLPFCWQQQSFAMDEVLAMPMRFSCGFMLSQQDCPDSRFGRGARAFGHPGAGGCLGFADPDYQLGFGYVTNRMGQALRIDARAIHLIDTAYTILESAKNE
ncbi:MAG TPA: serine hydrolase domain-containing protein [Cellvibrio sp.]|nr:serine hydrolase domain-containing protein [Cellvibrio sp.]